MTRRELINDIISAAKPVYGEREAVAIARLVAEKRYGLTRADLTLDPDAELDTGLEPGDGFDALLADIAAARPVQYILGTADFHGLELEVGEGVLIPRPETEELVRWIITNCELQITSDPAPCILDMGTGSGAIAIALAKNLPGARVTGIDVSGEALEYARRNNEKYFAGVDLFEADILELGNSESDNISRSSFSIFNFQFSIIVSNPPYIPAAERKSMAANVTEYEPKGALFVPDDDPLIFYRAIAQFARRRLAHEGALYFEIHENLAAEVAELLVAEGFDRIEVHEDINSKPRMIRACLECRH